jgi:hypothetical protein
MMMGIADFPIETLKLLNIHPENKGKGKGKADSVSGESVRTGRNKTPKPATSTQLSASSSASTLPGIQTQISNEVAPGSPGELPRGSSSSDLARVGSPGTPTRRTTFMAQAMAASTQVSRTRSPSQDHCPTDRFRHGRAKSVSAFELRSEAGSSMSFADKVHNMNSDAAVNTGKGIGRIIGAGFKSPLDFTLNVSKGFHNVPKLMGGDVRQVDKVTDLQSGMRTAAKVCINMDSAMICSNANFDVIYRSLVSAYTKVYQVSSQIRSKAPKRKAASALLKASAAASSAFSLVLEQVSSAFPPT